MIGIGGEGIVIGKELEIKMMQGTAKNEWSKKAENIQSKSKARSVTALKFVEFESNAKEDFQGKGFKKF